MAKNKETYYIIEEDCDQLTCVQAPSAVAAIKHLFEDLPEETKDFHVTVFRAKDAKRFVVSTETESHTTTTVESVR